MFCKNYRLFKQQVFEIFFKS